MNAFYNLLSMLRTLFDHVLRTIKENYLLILFFVLLAIAITILVNKIHCFKTVKNSKRLISFGIWIIPVRILFFGLKDFLLEYIGASTKYVWVKITLKILPTLFAILSIIFIVSGIYAVSAERKKSCKPNIEKIKKEDITSILD